MSIKANREELLGRLQSVQAGLSQKEVLEQSNCLIFQRGQVMSFNDEISCRTNSGLGKKLVGAVQARPLLELLGKLTEDEIDLEATDSELIVSGVKRKAGIRMEAEVLLNLADVEEPGDWSPLPEDFDEAVQIVASCAGVDDSRFSLTCVHFTPKYLEACDNFQMTRYKLKSGFKEDCLIRQKSLKHIITLGMSEVSETPAWLHFRNTNGLVFSCRRYLEEFPSLAEVLASEGVSATLPGGLAEAVDKAQLFSVAGGDDNKVKVELSSNRLRIRGEGSSGWYSETKNIKYDGNPLAFYVSPKILMEITKKHTDVQVSSARLIVNGGKFKYIACLFVDNGETKEAKEKEAVE